MVTETVVNDLHRMFAQFERKLSETSAMPDQAGQVHSSLRSIEHSLNFQTRKLIDLEDRSRLSNLVIHGIPENHNEMEASLKETVVKGVFQERMEVKCESIGRIHRLGKQKGKRPVIIYLQDYNEKKVILENAKKLKGSSIFIHNDYSQSTLKKRKLLWNSARQDKQQGKKSNLDSR